MRFSFLHAADLHLGSPLLGLGFKDAGLARQFAAASRQAFSGLVTFAIEKSVAFVIIAGDCFDGDWKDSSIGLFFNRELARLDRAKIPVFLLKGNHDAESIISKNPTWPQNVKQFPAKKAETFYLEEIKVALHGRSFHERAAKENYAQSYPSPKPGWFDIGVLHTSCEGNSSHAVYAPCTIADMSLRNYDYWALGHVHAFEILNRDPAIVYSGNLQGRSVRECGPKGAVFVEVEDSAIASITHVPFDQARFGKIAIDVTGAVTFPDILSGLAAAIQSEAVRAEGRPLALRIELFGQSALHRKLKANANDFAVEVQAEADRQRENIFLEKLVLSTSELSVRNPRDEASSLDLAAMLNELLDDPALHKNAGEIYKQVLDKMPESARDMLDGTGSESPDAAEIDNMIAAAGALILGRAFE